MTNSKNKRAAIFLAAGKGKRMKSNRPKVVHEIDGVPMIRLLLDRLLPLGFERVIIVIGHEGEQVKQALTGYDLDFVWQREQLGTGHAVKMARDRLADFDGTTLVVAGDVPFLSRESVDKLIAVHHQSGAAATCLSAIFEDPTGYGRIIRDGTGDALVDIIEHRDATDEIRGIKEINSGTFCFDNRLLFETLEAITADNDQAEYYLTDAVKVLHSKGLRVSVLPAGNPDEVLGVNSEDQLLQLVAKFSNRS